MATYSHSRVSTYENCPYKYKLQYIERKKPDIQNTIEAFMGDLVHRTLEKLYNDKKFKKRVSKAMLLKFYKDLWDKEYSDDVLIAKADQGLTFENYKKMGEGFISKYYDRMKPFDQLTILGLETTDRMTLSDGNQWHVRIDKFACDNEGNYFVCDYKTNARMKDQEEADQDRQLAMYSIWVKDKFQDVKSVKLLWHMLAFDKDVISERTDEQLEKLQNEIVDRIKEMESAKEFPTNVTGLCAYCGFKSECPSFKHQVELESKESIKEFKEDEGVVLVDKYSEVKNKLSELKKEEDELKERLIKFAEQFGADIVYGSNMKTSVKEIEKVTLPEENKEELINLLKEKGLYETYSMICSPRLYSHLIKGEIQDKDIRDKCEFGKDYRLSLSKRKDIEDDE
ncbi:MAG: PD-(D/E)XK nuclease family protein [Nanoarchaeota archaeon]|nr:PD-(D/E)XK nuclease family protein [Nanoarchaeota archaeon]